jgi:HD superfamily phosphodiesterase
MEIVKLSKAIMLEQTRKNKSPVWQLTEIAIDKGKELSKIYNVDERLVLTSLYLAHTIFSPVWKDETQKNHPKLSSEFAVKYLDQWNVKEKDKEIIINAIESHHNKVEPKSKTAEVVKNAECFKFVTLKGCLIYFHELGLRGIDYKESVHRVLYKMQSKRNLLTLDKCIREADKNCKEIMKVFNQE